MSSSDTNVVLTLLDGGPKADAAKVLMAQRPRISVQVLNEALVNCRRRAGMSWAEANAFLSAVGSLCLVEPLTLKTHEVGRALAERYTLPVTDAMIVAAALLAGCTTLYSEDMHPALVVEGRLRLVDPFA